MITVVQQFKAWLLLVILTILSVLLGSFFNLKIANHSLFIILVMAIVVLKGQQIIGVFMELSCAPKKWYMLLLSYIIIVPSVIAFIYIW